MEIKDFWGRTIRLTDERIEHLMGNHPEIKSESIAVIIETLQQPEQIFVSNSDDTVELFYRYYLKTSVGDKYMCVVVKNLETDFFVITAYFTDKIKKGELLWTKT